MERLAVLRKKKDGNTSTQVALNQFFRLGKKTIDADGFVFLISGIMLPCHRSVMCKWVLCGDKQQSGMDDFGPDQGDGHGYGKSWDDSGRR